jgi:hypothetical protein
MSFRQVTVSGFPALALRGAGIEAIVAPALGMKITNLRRLRGREWLWRSDQIPLAPGAPGASYVETADSGGWDECFPTVGPCPMPGEPAAPPLPDHGELWSARWESAVTDHAGGTTLTGTTTGTRFPYEFERAITLDAHESSAFAIGSGIWAGHRFPGYGRVTRCSTCSRAPRCNCPVYRRCGWMRRTAGPMRRTAIRWHGPAP